MMRTLFATALVVLGTVYPGGARAYEARPHCPGPATAERFFPARVLEPDRPDLDEFRRRWYAKHLSAMDEPSLSCGATTEAETYRFVWLRTFDRPVAVRVSRVGRDARLTAVESTGAGGYAPGTAAKRVSRTLSPPEWQALEAALRRADFWTTPTAPHAGEQGLDGAQWIIEARRGPAYHVVDRWSPPEGPYRELGLMFLRLAGWHAAGAGSY
jgi:hypothetical protein